MPVMPASLIANGGRLGSTPTSPIANIREGGQLGFGPNLPNLDANTPLVLLPLTIIVTHVPGVFNYIPNGVELFKAMLETNMLSMDGLDFQYTMETEGSPVGRDGQQQMVPMRQTRSQISPSGTFPERLGNLNFNIGKFWMDMMHDVDTQAASLAGIVPSGATLPPHVASMYSADLMCIQFDTTYRPENIVGAFALTNLFPTEIGGPDFRFNVNESHRPDRQFTFTAVVQHNRNVTAAAKQIARLLNLHLVNYQDALPIANDIEAQLQGEGLQHLVAETLSRFRNLDGVVGTL